MKKDGEEDTKKEGNKRHQKKDSVHMKSKVVAKFIIKVYQYAKILVGKAVSVQTSQ